MFPAHSWVLIRRCPHSEESSSEDEEHVKLFKYQRRLTLTLLSLLFSRMPAISDAIDNSLSTSRKLFSKMLDLVLPLLLLLSWKINRQNNVGRKSPKMSKCFSIFTKMSRQTQGVWLSNILLSRSIYKCGVIENNGRKPKHYNCYSILVYRLHVRVYISVNIFIHSSFIYGNGKFRVHRTCTDLSTTRRLYGGLRPKLGSESENIMQMGRYVLKIGNKGIYIYNWYRLSINETGTYICKKYILCQHPHST